MSSKDLRRLDLRLPPNHPIFAFDVEPRQRAKIAREWLDTGARLSGMEKQLARILEMLGSGTVKMQQEASAPQAQDKKDDQVNIGKMFEDAFS